jgi:hypothetical protein
MKGKKETLYSMNIATESARRAKIEQAEWMKKVVCFNC